MQRLRPERNRLVFKGWVLQPFDRVALQSDFDCGNADLNEFFREDVIPHEEQLIAKTFLLTPEGAAITEGFPPVAFISYSNDVIRKKQLDAKAATEEAVRALQALPEPKQYPSIPAVKIGRLAVQKEWRRQGAGTHLLNITKALFRADNRTGCRFLTVDAYNNGEVLDFYLKNNFAFLTDKDKNKTQRTMFFDLKRTPKEEIDEILQSSGWL